MKHRIRTRSMLPTGVGRSVAALLLALGMVLLSPALVAAQDDTDAPVAGPEGPNPQVVPVDDDETPDDGTPADDEDDGTPDDGGAGDVEPGDDTPGDDTTTTVPEEEEDAGPENIHIEFFPMEPQPPACQPQAFARTQMMPYMRSNDEIYQMRIRVNVPLCEPLEVTAAIYAMPETGTEPWPQTFVESETFVIEEAGDWVVTFTKTCQRVQFDVLTGATPEVIQPLGEWHGPLLFPFDADTSLQHWGCPVEVAAATTVPPAVAPAPRALTGGTSTPFAVGGAAVLFAGAVVLLVSRRRTA